MTEWYDDLKVVGTSFRKEALSLLLKEQTTYSAIAELHPEPSNPHDPNAIRVQIDGFHCGYISRLQTEQVHRELAVSPDWTLRVPVTVYRLSKSHTPAVNVGAAPAATEAQLDMIRRLASERYADQNEDPINLEGLDLFEASKLIDRLQRQEPIDPSRDNATRFDYDPYVQLAPEWTV